MFGFHAQSALKVGIFGLLKTGSEHHGPDPVGGLGTGGKGVRGSGSHIRDQIRGNVPDIVLPEMLDISLMHRKRPATPAEIQVPVQLRFGPSGSTHVGEGTGLSLSSVLAGKKTKDAATEPVVGDVPIARTVQIRHLERIPLLKGAGQSEILRPQASLLSWKSLFSANSSTKSSLGFFAPERVDGKPVIHPPTEAVVEGMKLWEGCKVILG